MNYTHCDVPFTRIIEHKHFEFDDRCPADNQSKTVISREYPAEWKPGVERYYPVNSEKNNSLYKQYEQLACERDDVIFGGRLGLYRYLDMDEVIMLALNQSNKIFERGTYDEKV